MKKLAYLAALVLLAGCATTESAIKKDATFHKYKKIYLADADQDPRKVLPKVKQRFEAMGFETHLVDEDSPLFGNQGTGFIISPQGHILTSAHVIGDAKEATVWLDGKRHEAELLYIGVDKASGLAEDEKSDDQSAVQKNLQAALNSKSNRSILDDLRFQDFALLKIKGSGHAFKPATFAPEPVYTIGSDVYTIGFPLSHILGNKPRLNKGLISSPVGIKDDPNFVQISAEVQPGNSGGPLLNQKGQVIGIVQMSLDPMNVYTHTDSLPQNVNFAAKTQMIREFLAEGKERSAVALAEGDQTSFEAAQDSIVKVQAGNVSDEFLKQPKLLCSIEYTYLWDMWYRFQMFEVSLSDADTGEVVLKAGQYGDKVFNTEDASLDEIFAQIRAKMGR